MAESCGKFDRDGERYCSTQGVGGGRARVWATKGAKGGAPLLEITPQSHLAAPLTCFVWLTLDQQPEEKRKTRKRKSSENGEINEEDSSSNSTHIAFGTSSGRVLIYSLARAKIETTLNDKSYSNGITAIDWSRRFGLYTCSADSSVKEWSISDNRMKSKFNMNKITGSVESPSVTVIKLVSDTQDSYFNKSKFMLSASHQITLWCLLTKQPLRTMIGHSSNVSLLEAIPFAEENKIYVISGSKNDRILSLWSLAISESDLDNIKETNDSDSPEDSKQRKKNFKKRKSSASSENVVSANCNFLMEDIARQISVSTHAKKQNVIKLCAVTRSGVVHFYEHTLNGLLSKPLKPSTTLQLATEENDGSVSPSPIVCCMLNRDFTVQIGYSLGLGMIFEQIVPNTSEKLQVLIRLSKDKNASKKENQKQKSESITKIKQSDEIDKSVVFLPSIVSRGESNDLKRPIGGKKGDVPMESRLANLSIAQTGTNQLSDSSNFAQLLVQALHSKDKKLLQTVFECKDPDTAYSSINRLPIQYISPLLDHLIEMLSSKTNQCRSACVWADALCKAKSSSLLALGSADGGKLQELKTALAARLPSLPTLLGLRARLNLALHKSLEAANTPVSQAPLLDYKDSSSEDEMDDDMDNAVLNNADDDSASWNEEEDDGDNSSKMSDQEMSEDDDDASES